MKDKRNDSSAPLQCLGEILNQNGGCAVIDGGLATQLEFLGANINDPLWSALCLLTMPELIKKVHTQYLEAGAKIIITASYQATIPGFLSKGLTLEESEAKLGYGVKLACEAREEHLKRCWGVSNGSGTADNALVAASIGSYGAYLADGSEYSGDYGEEMTLEKLKEFHRRRLQLLIESGPDLLAFETTPNKLETQAYVELLEEEDVKIPSWISFNSKDGVNIVSGDSFEECIAIADRCSKVTAVGINCTPPRFVHGLILAAKKVTSKPIVVYPNSGETFDPDKKEWVPTTGVSDMDFIPYVHKWRQAGAAFIGGCCRTTPNTIRAIAEALRINK